MQVLSKPLALSDSAAGAWLPVLCPECGLSRLSLVPTVDGRFDEFDCSIVCVYGCQTEFSLNEILNLLPGIIDWLPNSDPGSAKYWRGREDPLLFGSGLGSNKEGKARSEQFRYAIDIANNWEWNPKRPNGQAEMVRLYAMKATVGVFESKPMKSALEMCKRKLEKVAQKRGIKPSEPMVTRISKLLRKGIRNAESRRPTAPRERRLIVEEILRRQGLWPP
jgi:hypothetical protein